MADEKQFGAGMSEEAQKSKEALYRLGATLIRNRLWISVTVGLFTAVMAYFSFQLEMTTQFSDLLPYRHPFVKVHFKFANQFGGANNINVMLRVDKGDVFTQEMLTKIYEMTQAIDRVKGVNHDQISSIGHRTTRYLTVSSGTIGTPPVMRRPPKSREEVDLIRRICYNTESIYGQLVSVNGQALLIKANFLEGKLDYETLFDQIQRTVKEPFETAEHTIWVAGEPQLYGWIYHYASEVFYVFLGATVIAWLLLYIYFRDWRGALRPTITGIVSAFWGLGMQRLMGFAMDPLALVIPFFVTARAVSHSVQMHERYYDEYRKQNWDKEKAIIASFAELFVPTTSGIITDALGMLVIIVVPVVILQNIAISASVWVTSVAISELLLNPIVYYYLKAPERANVIRRQEASWLQNIVNRYADWMVQPRNCWIVVIVWSAAFLLALTQIRHLTIGDPTASTPLLHENSPYNIAHREIQGYFGGIEPLIIVVEGRDKGVLKDPAILRSMEKFQRYLERDPDIGYSFSLADIVSAINMTFYDMQPRWAVIPSETAKISALFFFYFAGAPPGETSKFLDPSYTSSHVTFYARNHQGDNVARILDHARTFVKENPMEKADFRLAGGLIGVTGAANEEILKNDLLMNFLGFFTMFVIIMFTYRSAVSAVLMIVSMFIANIIVNAYMGYRNIGINLQSLPVVTVGVGFGIDYGVYLVSRAVEEYRGDISEAMRMGIVTAGKAIAFTAVTLSLGAAMWMFSNIRFCSEMGSLLALWMIVCFFCTCSLVPALIVLFKPKFFMRAVEEGIVG
ncbi:MAG: efflux RND transporter permease subunit [Candidatus Binatia bacterium]